MTIFLKVATAISRAANKMRLVALHHNTQAHFGKARGALNSLHQTRAAVYALQAQVKELDAVAYSTENTALAAQSHNNRTAALLKAVDL